MITDNELDARLGAADPVRVNPAPRLNTDSLVRTSEVAAVARRRRRILTGMGVAGVIAVGGAIAVPAAAEGLRFLAQTDWRCTSGSECDDPDAQWIDSSVPDTAGYVASVFPESIPFASSWSRAEVVERVSLALTDNPGLVSDVSVQRLFESLAFCTWTDQWLSSDRVDDRAGRDEATARLQEAASWPAMTATDGGGIMQMQAEFASAAEAGDRSGVAQGASANECASWTQ